MAGDGGGDAAGAGTCVFGLLLGIRGREKVFEGEFEFPALQADGSGFNGEGAGAKWLNLEAITVELFGKVGEADHLGGEEVHEKRHEELLALGLFGCPLAQDALEEDALVGDVLVDDPEAFVVRGEDKGVADLAKGLECGEGVEGVGQVRGAGGGWGCGRLRVGVANGNGIGGVELESSGDGWELRGLESEWGRVGCGRVRFGEGAVEGGGGAVGSKEGLVEAIEGGGAGAIEGSGDVVEMRGSLRFCLRPSVEITILSGRVRR